jgi:membrane-associated phospholipid phosphatase
MNDRRSVTARRVLPWLADAERIDIALYEAVARTETPHLDAAMRRLSSAADYSRLSLASAAVLALAGGPAGRRAATAGLASLAATTTFANLVVKPLGRRRRPTTDVQSPAERRLRTPSSRSFPSGHTACAVAFASGAGQRLPLVGIPLHVLATAVGYSRVHTGVHYPGDVVAGAVLGAVIADLVTPVLDRGSD